MIETEADLAGYLIQWLQNLGWTTYQEVRPEWGGPRADIVAVHEPMQKVWVLEAKMRFGFDLLDQALQWVRRAHLVSVVTPQPKKMWKDQIRDYVCRRMEIGWLEGFTRYGYIDGTEDRYDFRVRVEPVGQDYPDSGYFLDKVSSLHNEYGTAGSKSDYYTPFRHTCDKLRGYVSENPGVRLIDALRAIDHHYSSDSSGSRSLGKLIEQGVVSGLRVERVKNARTVFVS